MMYSSLLILILTLIFAAVAIAGSAKCPSSLSHLENKEFDTPTNMPGMEVDFVLCGSLPNGCPGSGCNSAGCCSVCQKWGGDQPGAACLGNKLTTVNMSAAGVLQLLYTGGDPVNDPSNPNAAGPRQVVISLKCGGGLMSRATFIDPGSQPSAPNHVPGTPWTFEIKAQTNVVCGPCTGKQDCGSCVAPSSKGNSSSTGCVWCLDNGPTRGYCGPAQYCRSYVTKPALCPADPCTKLKTCSSCASFKAAMCAWCEDDQGKATCVPSYKAAQCSGVFRDPTICPN